MNVAAGLVVAILLIIALFHALWGLGFSVPAADRESLAHMVIGQAVVPPAAACFVVAMGVSVIAVAAAVAGGLIAGPVSLARIICWLAVLVFAARAVGGYLPQFEQVFARPEALCEAHGEALARWASGEAAVLLPPARRAQRRRRTAGGT